MSCQDLAAVANVRSQYSGRPAGTPTQPRSQSQSKAKIHSDLALWLHPWTSAPTLWSCQLTADLMFASSLHFMFHGQPWRQNKSCSLCPIKHLLADRIAKNSTVCSSFNNFCKVPSCNYPIQPAANATLFSVFVQRPSLSLCELVEFTQF